MSNHARAVSPAITAFLGALALDASAAAYLRYPPAEEANLLTICWTGTQFVAAGQGGAIITSPDGLTWTPRQAPLAADWLGSAAGAGRMVLVGTGNACVSSEDGITWTARTLSDANPFETKCRVAYNGSVFAVTGSVDTWYSADAVSWTMEADTAADTFLSLAVNGSQFASLDYGTNSSNGMQRLWTSTGGAWTPATTNTTGMRDLVWAGVRYIAVGSGGVAATSADGSAWTPRSTGVTTDLERVIWTSTQAVAVGPAGTILTSPNGATWTVQTSNTTRPLKSAAWSGSRLVAVGEGGIVLSSPDGANWTIVKAASDPVLPIGVGWTGNSSLAAGANGTLHSSDGVTWTRTAAVNGPFSGAILPTPPRFRLASGAGRVAASIGNGQGLWSAPPDGSSWTRVEWREEGFGVLWDGQQFVALGASSPFFTAQVLTSPDGLTWTGAGGAIDGNHSRDIAWTGERYVTSRRWSTNLSDWTASTFQPSEPVRSNWWIFWTGSKLAGVSPTGQIATSVDGTVWTVTLPAAFESSFPLEDVAWTGSRLLAVHDSHKRVYESGLSGPWVQVNNRGGRTIAWTGSRALVATGSEIYSLEGPGFGMSPWHYWSSGLFTPAELNDPSISGPSADPDHDAQANLVEYATGTNPLSSADIPVISVLPTAQGTRFRWPQDSSRSDVIVKGQISFDLQVWDEITGNPVSGPPGGVRVMESQPFPGQTEAFFRLNVRLLE